VQSAQESSDGCPDALNSMAYLGDLPKDRPVLSESSAPASVERVCYKLGEKVEGGDCVFLYY
jgi:hypothetical protein